MNVVYISRFFKTCNLPYLGSIFKTKVSPTKIIKHNGNCFSSKQFPIDNISNLKANVLLYSYEKPKVFKFLTIFGPVQLAAWVFYGGFMFANLRDISESGIKTDEVLANRSFWRRINLGEMKYRIISTILCLAVGFSTAAICIALPSRIVRELILCKGGKVASIVTYGGFGKPFKQIVPLHHLSCHISRQQAKSYIAVKIKDRWFYYLVDCRGQFHQPVLFDYTVGTKSVKFY